MSGFCEKIRAKRTNPDNVDADEDVAGVGGVGGAGVGAGVGTSVCRPDAK